jgi:hypothetical protein
VRSSSSRAVPAVLEGIKAAQKELNDGGGILGGVLLAHDNGIIEPQELSFASEPLFFSFSMVGGLRRAEGVVPEPVAEAAS